MKNKIPTGTEEYENRFLEIIKEYCQGKDAFIKRKIMIAVITAHQTGQDLTPTLKAKDMKDLSDLLEAFQKNWEEKHKKWSFSMLVWANTQSLAEILSKELKEHEKESA